MKRGIQQLVDKGVRAHLADIDVHAVRVAPDPGYDGIPLLSVTIVYEGNSPTSEQKLSLLGHLRRILLKKDEEAFPFVKILSRDDDERLRSAAA